jgi:hypothetical protein
MELKKVDENRRGPGLSIPPQRGVDTVFEERFGDDQITSST